VIRAGLFALLVLLGCDGLGRNCPEGESPVWDPWRGWTCQPPQTAPGCFGLGCAQAVHLDAGLEPACIAVEGDDCSACAVAACCSESLACLDIDGGVCSPSDSAGAALAGCITDHCATQCPGVP
jgi:hypothetical protein